MFSLRRALILLGALLPIVAGAPYAAPAEDDAVAEAIPEKYLVLLKQGTPKAKFDAHTAWAADLETKSKSNERRRFRGVRRKNSFKRFSSYSGEFDQATIDKIRASDEVELVEADQNWTLDAFVTQTNAGWNLGSITHRAPGSLNYVYDTSGCSDTYGYVVDGGVNVEHAAFGGRATLGFNACEDANHTDTSGHGTHIAGIIASTTYGMCKNANVISVKVFVGNVAATSTILNGLTWAINDITANGREQTSVINLSLGGASSQVWKTAIANAVAAGVHIVIAAGNNNVDVKDISPANAPEAITVGSMSSSNARAPSSNWGPLIDIWAPGVNILSTWIGSTTATKTMSGTSMAAPHVAGLVLYLQRFEGPFTPAAMITRIRYYATNNVLTDVTESTNKLAYNGWGLVYQG
ncbi:MAG: Basic amino-acid permease [Sclerophora amabilis]|nr:MAG: Basic amino-acid permease [Sclerophora amabilis]